MISFKKIVSFKNLEIHAKKLFEIKRRMLESKQGGFEIQPKEDLEIYAKKTFEIHAKKTFEIQIFE